jgi:hypothetical protein
MAASTGNEQTEWTAAIVKVELKAAFEILFDTTGRVGPGGHKSNWPEYLQQVTQSDNAEQQLSGTNAVGRMRARVQRSAREISNMEKVLLGHKGKDGKLHPAWPIGFLKDSDGKYAVGMRRMNARSGAGLTQRFDVDGIGQPRSLRFR